MWTHARHYSMSPSGSFLQATEAASSKQKEIQGNQLPEEWNLTNRKQEKKGIWPLNTPSFISSTDNSEVWFYFKCGFSFQSFLESPICQTNVPGVWTAISCGSLWSVEQCNHAMHPSVSHLSLSHFCFFLTFTVLSLHLPKNVSTLTLASGSAF